MNRYFYHSFPRRAGIDASRHGLTILASILDRGLLLTPERIEFNEQLTDGGQSPPVWIFQKRVCFTELAPQELPAHARVFGPFAAEWEVHALRRLGAIPVFYVPLSENPDGLEGMASAMLIRLGEVQELLVRFGRLKSALRKEPRPEEPLNVTKNGRTVATLRCTVGGATDLVGFLEQGLQPVEALVASLRAVCGYFYPTENLRFTEELGYYRQREWRIVGNVAHLGESLMHPVSEDDVRFLCAIDAEFFGRRREFPMGTFKVAEQCQWFNGVEGQTIGQSLRRIIVPKSDLLGAEKLVASRNLTTAVVPLESIGS